MILKINHIAIAVSDLDEAANHLGAAIGLTEVHREEVAEQKVKTASFQVGESTLELVSPTDPASPVGKFIEAKGEGIHHVALEVEDIASTLKTLKDRGVRLIDEEPRVGAGGHKIAFLHPKANRGVLIELVELKK
ncbi:MAG: methylmalonyl-CoA epimerase [Pseudomonadota bacterium]